MRNAIGAVILAALYGTSFAQTRPDFSGKWTQVSERHTYQISSVTPPPSIMIVSQDGSTLKVAASEPGAVARVYKLDGSESRNVWHVNAQQIDRISTAKWAGEHIVISTPVFHKITIPWNPPAPFGSYTNIRCGASGMAI